MENKGGDGLMVMFLVSSGKITKLLVCGAPSIKEVTVSGLDGDVRILAQEGSLSKSSGKPWYNS